VCVCSGGMVCAYAPCCGIMLGVMQDFMVPTAKEILFFSKAVFVPGDCVKFQDISRTWKMNLLFSRFSTTRGNPNYL